MLSVNYPNSTVRSFDLTGFFYGCLDSQTFVPLPCLVTVAGYRGFDKQVSNAVPACSRQFNYNPSTSLGSKQMADSGPIQNCSAIQFAIIQYSLPDELAVAQSDAAFALDNVAYLHRQC